MVVLGIDPGCRYAGFGIIRKQQNMILIVEHGCLKLNPTKPLTERVALFHDFFAQKIVEHTITDLALETPFLGKNAQNFLKLGYLRGILYLLSHKHNLVLHEFSPTEVKQQVTGFGGASKDQVARVVSRLFPRINPVFEKEDISDALAVTLCGIWHSKRYAAK
ncbi:MAG TPA: crossover junction endodeoxyribonuclease RuvC [Candidatus Babeliales bacterium]|jgi:crossover junction endodeoxyribonuclease RuvC|nr:crossover junction endodeoxyribonuclease RuvC [Candidatus Babeliales bacterium]